MVGSSTVMLVAVCVVQTHTGYWVCYSVKEWMSGSLLSTRHGLPWCTKMNKWTTPNAFFCECDQPTIDMLHCSLQRIEPDSHLFTQTVDDKCMCARQFLKENNQQTASNPKKRSPPQTTTKQNQNNTEGGLLYKQAWVSKTFVVMHRLRLICIGCDVFQFKYRAKKLLPSVLQYHSTWLFTVSRWRITCVGTPLFSLRT